MDQMMPKSEPILYDDMLKNANKIVPKRRRRTMRLASNEELLERAEKAEKEVERLQGFDHIRSIMVFYINREPMGDENIEVDDIVREYLAEGREE